MSTQVRSAGRRSRMSAIIVGLVLAFVVLLLATQASSILSGRTGSHVRPVPVNVPPTANAGPRNHLPAGCRVKYGCPHGSTTSGPRNHIPAGCRVKYGCPHGGSTTSERP